MLSGMHKFRILNLSIDLIVEIDLFGPAIDSNRFALMTSLN